MHIGSSHPAAPTCHHHTSSYPYLTLPQWRYQQQLKKGQSCEGAFRGALREWMRIMPQENAKQVLREAAAAGLPWTDLGCDPEQLHPADGPNQGVEGCTTHMIAEPASPSCPSSLISQPASEVLQAPSYPAQMGANACWPLSAQGHQNHLPAHASEQLGEHVAGMPLQLLDQGGGAPQGAAWGSSAGAPATLQTSPSSSLTASLGMEPLLQVELAVDLAQHLKWPQGQPVSPLVVELPAGLACTPVAPDPWCMQDAPVPSSTQPVSGAPRQLICRPGPQRSLLPKRLHQQQQLATEPGMLGMPQGLHLQASTGGPLPVDLSSWNGSVILLQADDLGAGQQWQIQPKTQQSTNPGTSAPFVPSGPLPFSLAPGQVLLYSLPAQ